MAPSGMNDEMQPADAAESQSLDLVQRMVVSLLVGGVVGMVTSVLCYYLAVRGRYELPPSSVTGLWVMTVVLGLVTAVTVLLLNRRKPYHPLVLLGLLPAGISWYWIFS